MKNLLFFAAFWAILSLPATALSFLSSSALSGQPNASGEYTSIIEGFDWGPAVSRVVLTLESPTKQASYHDYQVMIKRHSACADLPDAQSMGERDVVHAYVSDAEGNIAEENRFLTLVLSVSPNNPLSSPIQYSNSGDCQGNHWLDYQITIIQKKSLHIWNQEVNRIMPIIDRFDMSGEFTHQNQSLTYAYYEPDDSERKHPLIIWLHGGGEGGTDPSIPLVANRAANYASDEIQAIFGGAYVLSPQTPTYWMDNGEGSYTTGQVDDIYHQALMALIESFVENNPGIDRNRIYLGGCSNGGYMTLKLLLENPDYFAAGFPSALAYQSKYLSDEEIQILGDIPIWFIHAKDDPVTVANETVIPVYDRLKSSNAKNVHLSLYDHVVDITGFYGGNDYRYSGHWSWIYSHANASRRDADGSLVLLKGRPTTIMEWLAAQKR